MRRNEIPILVCSLILVGGCMAYVEPPAVYAPAPTVVAVPVLPPRVILDARPSYRHRGYYYYWDDGRGFWLYSKGRKGPWYQLPRTHYPQTFRYRDRWYDRDGRHDRGRDRR